MKVLRLKLAKMQKFTDDCMVGGQVIIQMSVKFRDFEEIHLHSFSTKL